MIFPTYFWLPNFMADGDPLRPERVAELADIALRAGMVVVADDLMLVPDVLMIEAVANGLDELIGVVVTNEDGRSVWTSQVDRGGHQ